MCIQSQENLFLAQGVLFGFKQHLFAVGHIWSCAAAGRWVPFTGTAHVPLMLHVLRFVPCSQSFELMSGLAHELPALPLLCWRTLLLLQAALQDTPAVAPGDQQLHQGRPQQEQPSAQPSVLQSVEEAAGVYAAHTSVESALRCLVTQGPLALAPHSAALLTLLHTAHTGGDTTCADPMWLLHALLEVMNSCCPDSPSATHHIAVFQAALGLFMDLHDGQASGSQGQQLPVAVQPSQLGPALGHYCRVVPEAAELGSRLGDWLLRHCEQLHR